MKQQTYNTQFHHVFEVRLGGTEYPQELEFIFEAIVETQEEPFGEDADGRRGGLAREVLSIDVHTMILRLPNRPGVRLFETEEEIEHFLTKEEFQKLVDRAQEMVFCGEAEEV